MPYRTRDFLLFAILFIALLVSSTGIYLETSTQKTGPQVASVVFSKGGEEVIYTAKVSEEEVLDRTSLLSKMRAKVSGQAVTLPSGVTETISEVVTVPTASSEVSLCPHYRLFEGAWNPTGLEFSVVEGARLLTRPVSDPVTQSQVREVVLQLPLLTWSSADKTCLASDVVGIATRGSLIRNNEHKPFSVFGEETLIGYALDGFPIYGLSERLTDECGGVVVNGEYRYYLNPTRPAVIGCFSGNPTYW